MYKVFDKDKSVFFVSRESEAAATGPSLKMSITDDEQVMKVYRDFRKDKVYRSLVLISPDVEQIWKVFSSFFYRIDAAGGRVRNNRNETLFIFRHGKWDLPKGKVEDGEEIADAAIREVEEECGIGGLSIIHELPSTFHIYTQDNREVLKRTYWFEMHSDDQNILVPQEEEGITEVKWMNEEATRKALKNTYDSIIEVMKAS